LFKIKAFLKNTHSHIVNISESRASLTGALFFGNNAEFGQNGILGQAPRRCYNIHGTGGRSFERGSEGDDG